MQVLCEWDCNIPSSAEGDWKLSGGRQWPTRRIVHQVTALASASAQEHAYLGVVC